MAEQHGEIDAKYINTHTPIYIYTYMYIYIYQNISNYCEILFQTQIGNLYRRALCRHINARNQADAAVEMPRSVQASVVLQQGSSRAFELNMYKQQHLEPIEVINDNDPCGLKGPSGYCCLLKANDLHFLQYYPGL